MKNYFEEIRMKLNKEIEIEDIEIVDNSHKHKKHPQNIKGSETHFIISLESDKFFKLSILDRQRYLINILGKNIIDKVHSISFKLTVPLKK